MASELAQAIRQVNERELDANEAALASCFPPPPKMSPEAQQQVVPFIQWTEAQRVRPLPAKPCTVAAFAQWQRDLGVPREKINATLAAISALHIAASVGDPVATPTVRMITAASTIEAPRSWDKDAKHRFAELPVELQRVVAARERDRERELRRAQNTAAEAAAEVRRLLKTAAETKPVVTNEKENENG
jgi:hypothetical protein